MHQPGAVGRPGEYGPGAGVGFYEMLYGKWPGDSDRFCKGDEGSRICTSGEDLFPELCILPLVQTGYRDGSERT